MLALHLRQLNLLTIHLLLLVVDRRLYWLGVIIISLHVAVRALVVSWDVHNRRTLRQLPTDLICSGLFFLVQVGCSIDLESLHLVDGFAATLGSGLRDCSVSVSLMLLHIVV